MSKCRETFSSKVCYFELGVQLAYASDINISLTSVAPDWTPLWELSSSAWMLIQTQTMSKHSSCLRQNVRPQMSRYSHRSLSHAQVVRHARLKILATSVFKWQDCFAGVTYQSSDESWFLSSVAASCPRARPKYFPWTSLWDSFSSCHFSVWVEECEIGFSAWTLQVTRHLFCGRCLSFAFGGFENVFLVMAVKTYLFNVWLKMNATFNKAKSILVIVSFFL